MIDNDDIAVNRLRQERQITHSQHFSVQNNNNSLLAHSQDSMLHTTGIDNIDQSELSIVNVDQSELSIVNADDANVSQITLIGEIYPGRDSSK